MTPYPPGPGFPLQAPSAKISTFFRKIPLIFYDNIIPSLYELFKSRSDKKYAENARFLYKMIKAPPKRSLYHKILRRRI